MDTDLSHKIITPKSGELVSLDQNYKTRANNKNQKNYVIATVYNIDVTTTRLTCCCDFKEYIICAGFSGELFFVNKSQLSVEYSYNVSNSIIRCIKVVPSELILLITTDAGELIIYDLQKKEKLYYEHSSSSIYNILFIDDHTFFTCEKNGDIYEWEYISSVGVFRNNKILNAGSAVFAMELVSGRLIVVNSIGEKIEYCLSTQKSKKRKMCESNIFCIKEGNDQTLYYGLSNGKILCEELDNDIYALDSHKDAVRDLEFSCNKEWIFSASKDKTIKAWRYGIPKVLTVSKEYLYQIIFIQSESALYYVDGCGYLGKIQFSSDIDVADEIVVK